MPRTVLISSLAVFFTQVMNMHLDGITADLVPTISQLLKLIAAEHPALDCASSSSN